MNLHKFAITALLLVSLNAGAADFNYQGETLVGVGLLGTLVPVGAIIDGTVEITSPGPGGTAAPGAFGIIDVRLAVTGFDGFCFTTLPEGVGCGGTGIFVPILSVDASTVAFDDTEFPVSGSFAITAFSNTLNQALPIVFDLDAGSFISDPMDVVLGSVSGVGSFVRPATISIAPNPAVFPDTVINGNSFADITVSNSGDLDLLVQSVAGVDGLAAPFAVTADGCSGMTLVTDASCNIQLQFSPTEPGSPADSFDIVSGDLANPTVTVDVSGTVLAPDIVVAPDPVAFVTTTIGETTDVEVTITNSGTADLSVGQIANPMDAQFSLAAGTDLCSNTTVAALGQCTFTLRFEPLTEGMFMTSLVIASDDFDTPSLTLNMTGTAIVGAVAEISVDPAELSFDELLVGQSATQSIVVTNAGNADLAISSFVFSGDDAADFGQKNDCPAALGSAATCTVSVLFAPLTGGTAKSATLTINSNADMEPVLLIPLSASAFDGPRIAVDPVELDFGSPAAPIDIGASTTATATISNSGNADLTITALDFVGGDDEFSVDSETCTTAPVVAEATCTVTVVFAPLSETDKTGTLSITSNDLSNTPTSVALNGFVFRGPRIGVAELAVQINDGVTVEVGQSAADVVVLQSTGTEDLTISSIVLGGNNPDEFEITENCTTNPIAPASECAVNIDFSPISSGNKSATLTITLGSPARGGAEQVVIVLSAVAADPPPIPPAPRTDPPAFALGDVGGTGSIGWFFLGVAIVLLISRRRRFEQHGQKGVQMRSMAKFAGLLVAVTIPHSAGAIGFESESGDWQGSWDTTLTYGMAYRLQAADDDLIGTINGGTKFSVNGDDGTQNFNRSIYSNALKATTELELNYKPGNLSLFMRGFYFEDFEITNGRRERTPLSQASLDRAGRNGDLLDAFIAWRFDIGEKPAEFRIGEQVINWGESTFIQGGANVINHFNVSALRVPGAELREALLPQDLAFFSVGLTPNLDIEVVYQYDWDDTEPDPVGTYFATNDFAVDGGSEVRLGFADTPDFPNPEFFPFERGFNTIPRGPTREPSDDGQWGWAARYFAPDFNNGTEFGFYYYNYHSRLPLISARTGTVEGLFAAAAILADAGLGGAADIAGATGAFLAANPGDTAGAMAAGVAAASAGVPEYVALGIADTVITGGNVAAFSSGYATDAFANTPSTGAGPFGTPAGGTSHFFTSYPEDIQMYALSINTTIGQTALQGEIAHHKNRPLQIDDLELLFAGLSPLRTQFAQFGQLGSFSFTSASPQFNPDTPPLTEITGFLRRDYTQADMALTRLFGPMLGADLSVALFEIAYHHVHDFLPKDVLRLDGPATVTSGSAVLAEVAHAGKPIESADHFPDENSWGYRLAGRLDYSNIFGTSFNMATRFSWQHDVDGITPGPAGAFLEGRKAITIGNRFSYQNRWELDFSYTSFFGAGRYNEIHDRDFVASSIKYTF